VTVLGVLAAEIVHEINNPLTGMLTFAHLVRVKIPDGSAEAEDMSIIIRETIQLVEHHAAFQNVAFAIDLDPELPTIWMDESHLKQVIMNLIVNARDAMGDRGRLSLRSRRSPSLFSPGTGHRTIPAVELTFTDTGCGIPTEDLPKIFDPFFTSKEPGKGVGLGLSVGYSIVKAHGGAIDVESEVGRGTTFRIVLPVDGVPPEGGKEAHASEDPGR